MPSNIVGRVIVGVDGSVGSLEALRHALGLARRLEATLMPVRAWQLPGGEITARRAPSPHYTQLLGEFAETALRRAFEEAVGSLPPDIDTQPYVIVGAAGPALVHMARRSHDLLVIGAGRRGRIRHALHARTARYCLSSAVCPVIAVPPPPLQAELPAQWRRRISADRLIDKLAHSHTGSDAR
jgi:nucleotide-binding universal stress UspA family protein